MDRWQVDVRRRMEPSHTNRPEGFLLKHALQFGPRDRTMRLEPAEHSADETHPGLSVATAEGPHPTPFRTRKLSPPAPMVMSWQRGVRVGRRRRFSSPVDSPAESAGVFCFLLPGRGTARGATDRKVGERPGRRGEKGRGAADGPAPGGCSASHGLGGVLWPKRSEPQHSTVSSSRRPQVWFAPAAIVS